MIYFFLIFNRNLQVVEYIVYFRGLTLHEALAMIDDVNFPHPGADITIFPPENACEYITDEDSGDEDNVYPNNLPGSQLRAPAEINLTQQEDEDTGFDAEDHIPLAQLQSTNADNSVMNK